MTPGAISPLAGRQEAVRLFVLEAPLLAGLADLSGRLVAVSQKVEHLGRFDQAQLVGRPLDDVFPGSEASLIEARAALAAGKPSFVLEQQAPMPPDGALRWLRVRVSYWRSDAGDPVGYLFISEDFTIEREAQLRHDETEALLRAVLDNMPGLWVQDIETDTFVLANARSLVELGVSADEVIGKRPSDIVPPERAVIYAQEAERATATGQVVVSERMSEFGPNAGDIFLMRKVPFKQGGRDRLLVVSENVTEARRATEALERVASEAQAANQAKSVFLANMSHEIRTPLNGVMGVASALSKTQLDVAQSEMVGLIENSAKALESLLSDILDLARVEAGRLELKGEPFDLGELVGACGSLFGSAAEAKGLVFATTISSEAAGVFVGDSLRLRQILSNLLGNAVKFTQKGSVWLKVSKAHAGPAAPLRFEVRDTGIGFDDETGERLFHRFEQADGSITRRYGGAGLGLAISRALAERMGGRLEASGKPGGGASFTLTVTLPRAAQALAHTPAAPVRPSSLAGMRVLLAEDHPINRRVAELILGSAGVDLTSVENGGEAVAAWSAKPFDLILMDLQMPVMDGLTAIRAIRAAEATQSRQPTPIFALTANAMHEDVSRSRDAGADAHLTKPIDARTLISAVEGVRTGAAKEAASAP
jgi:PAS domain S-box-containing protein